MMQKSFYTILLSAAFMAAVPTHAQVRVEIAVVSSNQIPVAVATFADEGVAPAQVSAIIRADLERSGVLKVIDAGTVLSESAPVDYAQWQGRGADALVVGSVHKGADGRIDVRYKLLDTIKSSELSTMS